MEDLLPQALLVGISYSDFWKMTIGEIYDVLQANADRQKAEADERAELFKLQAKQAIQNAALTAYFGGYYSRSYVKLPETLRSAFPTIFDTEQQSQDWRQTYRMLEKKRMEFKARHKERAANNGNS